MDYYIFFKRVLVKNMKKNIDATICQLHVDFVRSVQEDSIKVETLVQVLSGHVE